MYTDWDEALAACGEHEQICGTYRGDEPVYFVMPRDASDTEIRDRAFEVKNGRRMGRYDHWLLEQATKRGVLQ